MPLTERYVSALASGSGDGTIGNPWTIQQAWDDTGINKLVWVKKDGTYPLVPSTTTLAATPTPSQPIIFRGYNTTPGDGYLGWDANGRLITTNMPVFSGTANAYQRFPAKAWTVLENINMVAAHPRDSITQNVSFVTLIRCAATKQGAAGSESGVLSGTAAGNTLIECDFELGSGVHFGIATNVQGDFFAVACRFSAAGATAGVGVFSQSFRGTVVGCLFLDFPGVALGQPNNATNSGPFVAILNTFANCVVAMSSPAIAWQSGRMANLIFGNQITGCGTAYLNYHNATSVHPLVGAWNRLRDNTSNFTGFGDWPLYSAITTDTGGDETDYVNAAGGILQLIAASPASRALPFGMSAGAWPAAGGAASIQPPFWGDD